MAYTIKQGDLTPGIAGQITVPEEIDLTGVDLTMRVRGRTIGTVRDISVVNDGETAVDSNIFAWHYEWVEGDTDESDVYDFEIRCEVAGRPMTFPNSGLASFTIEAAIPEPEA